MGGVDRSVALESSHGEALVGLAAATIAARLRAGPPPVHAIPREAVLHEVGASFVTLERCGRLRGCVGTVEPSRPLWRDVCRNALRAMVDPRMEPVAVAEWPELVVKVSVLSTPQPLPVADLAQLVTALRPGVDGLVLSEDDRRATFLPSVWRSLPESARFVAALLHKGGWPPGYWSPRMIVTRYSTVEFHDDAGRPPLV